MKFITRRPIMMFGIIAFFGTTGVAGCSVARLQAGLEAPSEAVLLAANEATESLDFPTPIAEYDRFDVRVTPDLSVSVHARESEVASANIFLVHGAGGGAWAWEYFFEELPDSYNVYALSWRGHFDSDPVDDARAAHYVMDQEAVLGAITSRNDLPLHVVGHSYGGATATLQTAQTEIPVQSLTLLAPVVPLDYTFSQRLIVPAIAPYFIKTGEPDTLDGTYGGMFLSDARKQYYFERYASQDYSIEKPGLIAGDGISSAWQNQLEDAFVTIVDKNISTLIISARFDNVVVPRRQRRIADLHQIEMITLDSGHYITLDLLAEDSVRLVVDHISRVTKTAQRDQF